MSKNLLHSGRCQSVFIVKCASATLLSKCCGIANSLFCTIRANNNILMDSMDPAIELEQQPQLNAIVAEMALNI